MRPWLLLIYKIPRNPTSGRVYVWRKLKQLGAVALQDAAWVLPNTPKTLEQFRWLSTEITELGGDATLLSAEQVYATDDEGMKKKFMEPLEAEYGAILEALEQQDPDLGDLSRRFLQAQAQDYFASELGLSVRERLLSASEGETS